MIYTRREWLRAGALGAAGLMISGRALRALAPKPIAITVYKTPTCGCCKDWVAHLGKNGFVATVHDLPDLAETKTMLGIPSALQSCHTGVTGRYAIEGHVPADLIKKLIADNSTTIAGLAVPGMPAGSPGMEMGRKEPYDVIAFTKAGKTSVYARR